MTDEQKKSIEEIVGHLGAALSQAMPSDDAIIIGHIREAHAEASRLMSGGKIPAIAPKRGDSEYEHVPLAPGATVKTRYVHTGPIPAREIADGSTDLEECACGRTYEPVDGNGEDVDMCPTCRENAAEAAYERSQEEPCYRGGEWAAAQREEALRIKRDLKS